MIPIPHCVWTSTSPVLQSSTTVQYYSPVLQSSTTGLALVQGTRTLHTELAPGNRGCSQRW
eukprot:1093594-Prorocentrum_minimum.AAC.1